MQIFFKKTFFSFLILILSLSLKSQTGEFRLQGKVINKKKENLSRTKYILYKDNKIIDSAFTSVNGVFNIRFELNGQYLVEFVKKGYISKKIIVDTQVPNLYLGKFFNETNIIILDTIGAGDYRSLAGLPVIKYYFNVKKNGFSAKKLTGSKGNEDVLIKHINKLKKELALYKKELEKQKEIAANMQKHSAVPDSILLIKAQKKADSILSVAKQRAYLILEASKKDSANRLSSVEKLSNNLSDEDFENLEVDKKQFKEKEAVVNYNKQIEELTKRQNKTAFDSLDIKEQKLGLRKEFLELAKTKLENDRLKARTHEDSLRIQQREAELFLIEQNMEMATKEIDAARKELKLKDLQIRQKNLIIYGVILGLLFLLILLVVIYRHYQEKKQMNSVLESQNDKLENQNEKITQQNKLLEKQHTQIMKSIDSGRRIQAAILPSDKLLKHFFPESFVFFRPRDVVSGDFYWFSVQDNKLFIAAVDCTGHGVPGAFMSLIGNTLLNHIVNEKGIYTPSAILKELHLGVRKALSQSKSEDNDDHADGMDISLCAFDKENKIIQLALANHVAIIVNNGEIQEIEGDEFGIADELLGDDEPNFTDHTFNMDKNSTLYLFSDGFPDQFGGPKNKKFYISKLKQLFIDIQNVSVPDQHDKISERFYEWKGNNSQLDDVLVMGFKLDIK